MVLPNNPRRVVVVIFPPDAGTLHVSLKPFTNSMDAMIRSSAITRQIEFTCVLHGPVPQEEFYIQTDGGQKFWTLEVVELP